MFTACHLSLLHPVRRDRTDNGTFPEQPPSQQVSEVRPWFAIRWTSMPFVIRRNRKPKDTKNNSRKATAKQTLVMTNSDPPSCQIFRRLSPFDGGENTEPILGSRLCLGCLQNECLWLPGNCLGAPAVSSGASPELLHLSSLLGCLLSLFALAMLSSSGTHSVLSSSL